MQDLPSDGAEKSAAKQIALMVAGAILVALAVLAWMYATRAMTSLVEHFWCTMAGAETCRFRGYQHFLIWTVLGIINLTILGLLLERVTERGGLPPD